MKLCFFGDVKDCIQGIEILSKDFDFIPVFCDDTCCCSDGFLVKVQKVQGGDVMVSKKGSDITLRYSERIHFFRALGLLLEQLKRQ